jgi:hypothetical protein
MPNYVVGCTECEYEKELIAVSYDTAVAHVCPTCKCPTVRRPCVSINRITGYSEENGYTREEIMYDGSSARKF